MNGCLVPNNHRLYPQGYCLTAPTPVVTYNAIMFGFNF